MKDYLIFFVVSAIGYVCVMSIGAMHTGAILLFVMVTTLSLRFTKKSRNANVIGYILWWGFILMLNHFVSTAAPEYFANHPEIKEQDARSLIGATILLWAIISNPIFYGLGRLTVYAWNKFHQPKQIDDKTS